MPFYLECRADWRSAHAGAAPFHRDFSGNARRKAQRHGPRLAADTRFWVQIKAITDPHGFVPDLLRADWDLVFSFGCHAALEQGGGHTRYHFRIVGH